MTTSKGLGISIKYGDHSRKMELRVNQQALDVRVPQGDNLRPALLRKLPSHFRLADDTPRIWWAPTVAARTSLWYLAKLARCGIQR
jgi:hypothetical protein